MHPQMQKIQFVIFGDMRVENNTSHSANVREKRVRCSGVQPSQKEPALFEAKLICNLDHRRSDYSVAELCPLLENLGNCVLAIVFVFLVHNRVVEIRVKSFALRVKNLDLEFCERFTELIEYELNTLFIVFVCARVCYCALKIVIKREKCFDCFRLRIAIYRFLFLCCALSEIVILCSEAKIFVVCFLCRLLGKLELRGLCRGLVSSAAVSSVTVSTVSSTASCAFSFLLFAICL